VLRLCGNFKNIDVHLHRRNSCLLDIWALPAVCIQLGGATVCLDRALGWATIFRLLIGLVAVKMVLVPS